MTRKTPFKPSCTIIRGGYANRAECVLEVDLPEIISGFYQVDGVLQWLISEWVMIGKIIKSAAIRSTGVVNNTIGFVRCVFGDRAKGRNDLRFVFNDYIMPIGQFIFYLSLHVWACLRVRSGFVIGRLNVEPRVHRFRYDIKSMPYSMKDIIPVWVVGRQ